MREIVRLSKLEGKRYCLETAIWSKAKKVILHHTWSPNSSQYTGPETVRAIQRYHVEERGWKDIGYHLLIAPNGDTYPGRPMTEYGAHCTGQNEHIGVACIANFDEEDPYAWGGIDQLRECLSILLSRMKVGVQGLHFHTEYAADKSCPGKRMRLSMRVELLSRNQNGVKVVGPDGTTISCNARLENNAVVRVDLRQFAEELGYVVDASKWPVILIRRH